MLKLLQILLQKVFKVQTHLTLNVSAASTT